MSGVSSTGLVCVVYSARVNGIVTPSLSAKLLFFSIRSLRMVVDQSRLEEIFNVR